MGITKQYLRFQPGPVFGVVGSLKSNIVYLDIQGSHAKLCAVGSCEDVIVWDLKTQEKYLTLKGEKHEVTIISRCPDNRHLAVGYNDGMVRVFSLINRECICTFSGHKSAVTALNYDHQGLQLVSGSKDTNVIVWDIVNEAGLYRLKGHKGQVTQAVFLKEKNVLVTSSKDTFIKFWDLDTQHCFKTLVNHRTEIYDFQIIKNGTRLITGSADSELRVWEIKYADKQVEDDEPPVGKKSKLENEDKDDDLNILTCVKLGSVIRQSRTHVVSMVTDKEEKVLLCHGNDKKVEMFSLPNEEDLKKRLSKKRKKARLKKSEEGNKVDEDEVTLAAEDYVKNITQVFLPAKVRSVDIELDEGQVKMMALLTNNSIETSTLDVQEKGCQRKNICSHGLPGHRTDVRTLCFSSDNTAIVTVSAESAKLWNRSSVKCIRTMSCDYSLCSVFAPGDRHIILGTKAGKLQIFDIASGDLLEDIEAHDSTIYSISLSPDKRGILTGSSDKTVKFWNFELVNQEGSSSKRLTVQHSRTLKMEEEVMCAKYSPDNRLFAVSLLDNTVKVFFVDTLKFFLSLYGHKLPVLSLDISTDGTLLISGSADRNIKIWGLDFGDCHKSIFAHDDSIMCVQFVPNTHLFFSGGKDKKLKQWDADSFEHILTLEGHHAEIWAMAVSYRGNFVATASHDKSLRLWERTQEPLILEEEREMEREKVFDEQVGQSGEPVVAGETTTEVGLAGKKSIETVKAAEKLMEALELYKEETAKLEEHQLECSRTGKKLPVPALHPMLIAFNCDSPNQYMIDNIKKIKSSELEESLLVLPFPYVSDLLQVLDKFLTLGWETELVCRCLFFLLRVHQGQITSNQVLLPVVDRLRSATSNRVNQLRDQIGFNLAGLQFLKRRLEDRDQIQFFADATTTRRKKKKKAEKVVLAIKT
ncbi:WD repeat-containing protein 3 [Patella vulgata]|uniref:WD repeat-containing protein 3 n=1 Tax=Patella vulgata TaxID=6465 RepID=UPI0024A96BE2|nr:WD repeat-containing protein 3 [Patella vulgata]